LIDFKAQRGGRITILFLLENKASYEYQILLFTDGENQL